MKVVISQPMLFPWVGMFEQIALADSFVYYDDVQFSKGSFVNRVQIKCPVGTAWLTIPVRKGPLNRSINQVAINNDIDWRKAHVDLLHKHYAEAPFFAEMLALVRKVYDRPYRWISEVSKASMESICHYFGLDEGRRFLVSGAMGIPGKSSQRVLDIVVALSGDRYITGHGAKHYLEHELFERAGVTVDYMDYAKIPYPQFYGDFTPFVSTLDLIAHLGRDGKKLLAPRTKNWKDFIDG